MTKPKIKITLADRIGKCGCHRGHKIGDTFDHDTERGKLCPMAMHVAFPYIDILRCGGIPPRASNGNIRFCCPEANVVITMGCNVQCPYLSCSHREDWGLDDPTGKDDEAFLETIRLKAML